MIPLGWVRSDGSGPPEVEQVANHGKISYDTVRGGVVAAPGDFALPACGQTALVGSEVWNFFPHHFWLIVR